METNKEVSEEVKPDFEEMSESYADANERRGCAYWQGLKRGHKAGLEMAWNDYETTSLREENGRLKIELSNYAYQIDMAKRERDKAESELERVTKENEELKKNIRQ
jgi:hypothetical protein